MAEKNIKISGIGDVTRADFVRAITDPDKFKEFADLLGWGNKRRLLAWNSLHNYAQGVLNGEINEINDMHLIVDDTGARTNKQEKYNWIGSKFDANGATAAFMNLIAKSMYTNSKSANKSLKSIPSVTSYLNQLWFGSNNPDWELFLKNDTLTNGVYGIANRSAKIKEGLTKYKNELTTNGALYNWDGVDKDALYKNLDAAIASSNVATYAPLGITSDYINNALATKDLSTMVADSDTDSTLTLASDDPTRGFSEEELARYNTMTPELLQQYLALRNAAINLNNEKFLAQNLADIDKANKEKEDTAFKNWLVTNGYYSPKALATSYVPSRLVLSSMVDSKGKKIEGPAVKSGKEFDKATNINSFTPQEWDNFIHGDLTSDIHNIYSLKNADIRRTTNGTVTIKSKLDWLNYNYLLLLDTGKLNEIGDDVSSYVGASKGTVWRLKNSKRSSDGTYMYMRKRGNNLEFYRSKSWGDLRNNEYKKHISKHLWGGGISSGLAKLREQYSKDLKARLDAIKKLQLISRVERTPLRGLRDLNKIKAGQRELGNLGLLTASDYALLGGITADIASTVSSFFGPAGTVVGAVSGLAGTGAHAFADFTDPSVSKGEAITNLGTNLLFDVAGAVPILGSYGKLAKLGRVGKALQNNARLYKLILGAVTAPGIIQAAPNAASAIKKLVTNPTTITADELRDLATAVSITSGLTKVAPNHNKVRTTNPNYGLNVVVHTNKGKLTISAKDYESIMDKTKNPTMRARNEVLAATTKVDGILFDNGIFHNYAPPSWNPFKFEGFYNKFGVVSRLGNTSDPETKYIYRPAKTLKNLNNKASKPTTNTELPKSALNLPTITNNPEKPLLTHTITPELQKKDIELLRKRFMSDKPLPIDNATRKAYEHYRKRPMTDLEIKDLEAELLAKRFMRDLYKLLKPQDLIYAERRDALLKNLSERKALAKDLENALREIKLAKANTQFKINIAEGNARAKNLPIPSARVIVTPESVRALANREFALNWEPAEFKPELKGAARSKKQAMYERLFLMPLAERQGTGSAVQHTTRKSLERLRKMLNAVLLEFLERQRKLNAIILSPTESRLGMYLQMFSPVLTNLDNLGRAMGLRAKPSKADVKSTKSSEYKLLLKLSRLLKASEVMEAFGNTKSNNIKGHNKNTNLPHKQSNKKKKTSRDNNIKRRLDGGVLYDYEFLKSVHAFKQGGVIKAQGGVRLNNIWAGKNLDYGYNTYLNRIFGNLDVLSWMRTHYVGDNATKLYADYVMKNVNDRSTYGINNYNNNSTYVANEGINTFNTGYLNAGNTLNYTLFGNNTKDYTDKKGVAYKLINFTRPDKALATGDSYNANPSKAYIDNALGLLTYSRVASLTDSGIKAGGFGDWGKYWKEQGNTGAYYYIAPGDTSGKGQWIPTNDKTLNGYQDFEVAPQETSKKDGSVTNPDIGKKSIFDKGKEYLAKLTSNPGNLYNAVETGKYLLANKATNDIFKIKAPNYVISPKHTSYQVMDNLALQNAYHSKAALTMNLTSRPLTSSGLLLTAALQESMNNANKLYLQGNAERNTWLEGLKQLSYKAGLYNMESAVDTANANAQLAYKTRMLNEYLDPRDRIRGLATNKQNWINALEKFNIIDPYVERKNALLQYGLAKALWDYQNDANVLAAQQKYLLLLRLHLNDLNFNAYDTDEYRNLINALKTAGAKYYNNMYLVYGISNPGFKYKKGGKFEDISKFNTKEFYNTIRHSINTATKLSGDLSKLINTLFKKSNKK